MTEAQQEPIFEVNGYYYPLSEMTMANAEVPEIVEWLRTARVGDSQDFGGGAAGELIVMRID